VIRAIVFVLAACDWCGQGAQSRPTFAAASVKPDTVGTNEGPGRGNENIETNPLSLTMRNVRLRSAMKWAYHMQTDQVSGPAWLDSERYLIFAKAAEPVSQDQLRLMLRQLLTDRFRIELHRETREMAVYAIAVDKGGPKFQESAEAGDGGTRYGIAKKVIAAKATLGQFADSLTNPLRAVVLDETGLKGHYDFTLDLDVYEPGDIAAEDMPGLVARGLREELGLRLETRKSPVPILVVDHAERDPVQN